MKCERFIFRGNLSILLIKVKKNFKCNWFLFQIQKIKNFGTQKFEFGTRNYSSNRAVSVHVLGSTRSSLPILEPSVSQVEVFHSRVMLKAFDPNRFRRKSEQQKGFDPWRTTVAEGMACFFPRLPP